MLAGRVAKPGVYLCAWCAVWGSVSACTGAVQSFEGMVVCRLLLGFTEAAFFPGAVYLLSMFYTRKQLALRTSLLYSGSQIGNAFGGLFALACLQLDGAHGLEGWRWLFVSSWSGRLIPDHRRRHDSRLRPHLRECGHDYTDSKATYIPNKPATMRWLTRQETDQLLFRLEQDRGTQDATDEITTKRASWLSLTDVSPTPTTNPSP